MSWEERVKIMNEDLETDQVRDDLQVSLTDLEYRDLKRLAYKAGFKSAGDLLSSFVGDLTTWHSNGSDERDIADQWYERAFFIHMAMFRSYLFERYNDLDLMTEMTVDRDFFEWIYKGYKEHNPDLEIESKEECLNTLQEILKEGKAL